MKKLYSLHQLCNFRSGTSTSVSPFGDVPCVQGRDFTAEGQYVAKEVQYAAESALKYAHFLQPGNILFSTKGKIFASVWNGQVPNAIASGTFIILIVNTDLVLPEYLSIYLNSAKAKRYFDLHTKAGTVIHIGKKDIELLQLELPILQRQKLIVNTWKLLMEEKQLQTELIIRKERMLNELL